MIKEKIIEFFKNDENRNFVIISSIIIFALCIGIAYNNYADETATRTTPSARASAKPTVTIKPSPTATPILTTDEKISEISKARFMGLESSSFDKDSGLVFVVTTYTPLMSFDEDKFIRDCSYNAVEAMGKLFKIDGVKKVQVQFKLDATDNYGNDTQFIGYFVRITKSESDKINYKNFGDLVFSDYNKLLNIAEYYTIHPSVKSKLKNLK